MLLALAELSDRLTLQRLSPSEWLALDAGQRPVLGALSYGGALAGSAAPVAARVLSPAGPKVDAWLGTGRALRRGVCGSVHWRDDGRWLWGELELDEGAEQADLCQLSERAYDDIFATLAATDCPHLLRLWNYLPHINADGGGIERYRQFNVGRQRAFLRARRSAFEGAPAACALGLHEGPLRVQFLAGRVAPVALENPRQVPAYHYPRDYGPRSPSFSRAALVEAGKGRVALLISGTSSIVGHRSLHAGDVAAQTRETVANLQAVLASARARCTAGFALADLQCVVYVRQAGDVVRVRAELESAFGAASAAVRGAIYLEADVCRSDLAVEVEAHAIADGEVLP